MVQWNNHCANVHCTLIRFIFAEKSHRLLLYKWHDKLCLTPFLWFYYYFEKALVILSVIYALFGYPVGNPFITFTVPLACGIYLGMKIAIYLIEYNVRKFVK